MSRFKRAKKVFEVGTTIKSSREDNKQFLDNRMTVFSWKNQLIMEKLGFYWENMIHYNNGGTDFQPARFDINNKKKGIQETFVMMPCRTFWENYNYDN